MSAALRCKGGHANSTAGITSPANKPADQWRGKCHASGRQSRLGGAVSTPGPYRRREPQFAGKNQIHPLRELAKLKFSYSFRKFAEFKITNQRHSLLVSSSNAPESIRSAPKLLP